MYEGWKILTYGRKIPKAEESVIRHKLRTWFSHGDWCFSENTHSVAIFYGPNNQKINVSFQEVEYGYHIVFESVFFGYKDDERAHRELCEKIIQKIPWKKQGFWLEDNAEIPIPRPKMLRMK